MAKSRMFPFFVLIIATFILPMIFNLGVSAESGEKNEIVSLNGEWEFYWKELLEPNDFKEYPLKPTHIQVPAAWKNQSINGKQLTSIGYGTYRTEITIPKDYLGRQQALTVHYIGSAYRIWINGDEYPGLGKVGKTKSEEKPQLQRNLIVFVPTSENVEVIVQVSNFSFREGGIINEVEFGQVHNIIPYVYKPMFLSLIQIGTVLIIGIYYLVIYFSRKIDLDFFYFGLFSISYALRCLLLSEYVVNMFFPTIPWTFIIRIEYIFESTTVLLLALFIKQVFPIDTNRHILRLLKTLTIISYILILFTTTYHFTALLPYYSLVFLGTLFYLMIDITIKVKRHKREDAALNLISIFLFLAGVVYEVSNYILIFSSIYILNYVFFVFILIQAIILSNRYKLFQEKSRKLAEELLILNNHLEERIEERTKELHEKNKELEAMQQTRSKILANIAHDIGTPLAGVGMYLNILKDGKVKINQEKVFDELIDKLVYIQHLNKDLLELSKLESKKLPFHFEKVMVQTFFNEIIQSLHLETQAKNMVLQYGKIATTVNDTQSYILADRLRLMQVVQNFISNAVKYNDSKEKIITLHCYIRSNDSKNENSYEVIFEVDDNGNGISPDEIPFIFEQFYRKVEGNIEGSGLGLAIVKEIIEQHGGQVGARNKEGEGSVFYFTLPASLK